MLRQICRLLPALLLFSCTPSPSAGPEASSPGFDLSAAEVIDLTHPFGPETLYWPTSPSGFELEPLAHGETEGGWFYSANAFQAPEHGGTHLDAPIHFAEDRWTTDEIPVERLTGPAVVIDISADAQADRDYRATVADIKAWEARNGTIDAGSIVLLNSGWDRNWGDREAVFGWAGRESSGSTETSAEPLDLHFPAWSEAAARFLVDERGVFGLGVDTPSIDHGPATDFPVHRVTAEANVYGLENVARLGDLPEAGAWIIALPMKIADGSGGPLRIVAFLPEPNRSPSSSPNP